MNLQTKRVLNSIDMILGKYFGQKSEFLPCFADPKIIQITIQACRLKKLNQSVGTVRATRAPKSKMARRVIKSLQGTVGRLEA